MHDLEFDLSKSLKVKGKGANGKLTCDIKCISNIRLSAVFYEIVIDNMHDLQFDLSRSLKVEANDGIKTPTYDFLLVNNYNYILICIGS